MLEASGSLSTATTQTTRAVLTSLMMEEDIPRIATVTATGGNSMPTQSPTTFPRTRNGWTDAGKQIKSTVGQRCPNCGSPRYRQTVSTEHCPDCGLHCDYWGGGTNQVYSDMMDRDARTRGDERLEREIRESLENREGPPLYYSDDE